MRGAVALVVVSLVGCAATAPRVSVWSSIEPFDGTPPTEPLELPDYPEFTDVGGLAAIDAAGGQTLQIYREAAEANTDLAWEHGEQIEDLRTAYNHLSRAGQAEFDLSELRQQTLEEERRNHFWSRIMDFILIGVLGVAAAR